MFAEMRDKSLFERANSYAMDYLAKAFDRNVYPTKEALKSLARFEENMPEQSGQAEDILDFLNQYGTPATVTHIGGRYFGFVNGSVVPAGLAAKNLSVYWDQNTAMQVLSPISSKLETVVQNWLIELFGLPKETVSGFVSGTSWPTSVALPPQDIGFCKTRAGILMKKDFLMHLK